MAGPHGVRSFQTAQGSIYTYDESGRTARLKVATGEHLATQDVTVFARLTAQQEQDFLSTYRETLLRDGKRIKVYVAEKQPDGTGRIIERLSDIGNPDRLALVAIDGHTEGRFQPGNVVMAVPATLQPTIGMNTFDTRSFRDAEGRFMRERHLGNKVTAIGYNEPAVSLVRRVDVGSTRRGPAASPVEVRNTPPSAPRHQVGSRTGPGAGTGRAAPAIDGLH